MAKELAMNAIKIEKNIEANCFLDFELRELAAIIDGDRFHWRMLHFHSLGSSDSEFNVPRFEHLAITSEHGLAMTWGEVQKLGSIVRQTIDCLLIGDENEDQLRRYKTDEEQYAASGIVLERIDGDDWEIHAKNPAIIERIARHFDGNDNFKITEI